MNNKIKVIKRRSYGCQCEPAWRFNNRENEHIFRDTLARMLGHRPLTYTRLTA